MLIKHTLNDEIVEVRYYFLAKCKCDKCYEPFTIESELEEIEDEAEREEDFLKTDFSLCRKCTLLIDELKKRQLSFI